MREEHAALDGITLPPSDKFWNHYLPPNGWNCRCTAVQVLKGKYPQSDSDRACAAADGIADTPKKQIFKFNPGKQMKVFPPKHPYLPKGCGDCNRTLLAYNANKEQCRACVTIKQIEDSRKKIESIKQARNNAIASITPATFKNELLSLNNIRTGFLYKSRKSTKTLLNHCYNEAAIETAMHVVNHLDKLEFVRSSYLGEGKDMKDATEREKIQKKSDRGVIQYNVYLYEYKGRRWVIKTEEYWDGQEKLYSFTKKP